LPIELSARRELRTARGETYNLSSSGVLFSTDRELKVGQSLEYTILLPVAPKGIKLRCFGTVVRLSESPVAAAATIDRYEFLREKPLS
jgi:hypothetical protein